MTWIARGHASMRDTGAVDHPGCLYVTEHMLGRIRIGALREILVPPASDYLVGDTIAVATRGQPDWTKVRVTGSWMADRQMFRLEVEPVDLPPQDQGKS